MRPASHRFVARVLVVALAAAASACGGSAASDAGVDGAPTDFGMFDLGAPDTSPVDASPDAQVDGGPQGCAVIDCDPTASASCGADAGICVLRSSAPPTCEPRATADGHVGEPCHTAGDCLDGLACFAVAGGGGTCGTVCCPGHTGGCSMAERCEGPAQLVSGDTSTWGRCVLPRACDVLAGTPCDPGEACYIVSDRGDTDCRIAGTADVGAPCSGPSDCRPGFVCTGLGASTCARICGLGDAGMPACPRSEGACRAYPYSPPGTGVCTP